MMSVGQASLTRVVTRPTAGKPDTLVRLFDNLKLISLIIHHPRFTMRTYFVFT